MNRRQNVQSGFTLVEILVTSILVVILAAVAIPLYTGYLHNQRVNSVKALAETAAVQANGLHRKGIADADIEEKVLANLFLPPNTYDISISEGTVTVTDLSDESATYSLSYE